MEQHLAATVQGTIEPQWLLDHVKAGAVISSEYTLNYCRDLAAAIKSEYRRRAMAMIDTLADRMSAAGEAAAAPLRARLSELAGQARALAQLTALAAEAAAHLTRLEALLPPAPSRLVLPKPRAPRSREVLDADFQSASLLVQKNNPYALTGLGEDAAAREFNPHQEGTQASGLVYTDASTAEPRMGEVEEAAADGGALAPQRLAAERLRRAASLLAPHDALAPAVQAMLDKADRLQSSRFTIALFGAFSAGKSSLANALLGEPVLPVSPNPTTAAVNRIVPPTVENKHGTASVILKTREAVLEDLRYSLSLLGEEPASLSAEELLQKIGKLSPDAIHAGGRPHYSFLKAAAKGWQEQEPLLGRQLIVDGGDYRRYVAEESRSCFVSEIELYHSNPLTEQGIVLVDTPGADSVNARHTGVAFNYIKNADAILFVTYYNHAFSQADRQFLLQLGRVKDQFELDKMFFLVNAADLAADEEELEGVLAHVERNLQQHGIRFPRMFPVSSLQALDAKLAGDHEQLAASGIQAFEQSFLAFTRGDLGNLAVASAEQELDRARLTIAQWVHAASGDAASRERAQQQLSAEAAAARIVAEELEHRQAGSNPQLEQEIRELLFYVQQRVQFRFGDHFNFAFNPAAIQDDGRDLRKALWTSWLELQRLLQIELAQELQATSLRLEHTLNRLAAKKFSDAAAEAANVLQGFAPSPFKPLELPTPEEQPNWQAEAIEPKWLWSRFKSPRHFFEGEGKAALRGALESELAEPLSSWISAAESAWSAEYSRFWEEAMRASAAALRKDIDSFAAGKLSSLSGSTGLSELQHLYSTLKAI
jgi:GTPase SAR1 family protein